MLEENIKRARKLAGLSQKDVAGLLGVTPSTYCGYETGKRKPNALMISKIAAILGVTGDYLLDIESAKPKAAPVTLSQDETELLSIYRSMNNATKKVFLANARIYAGNPEAQEGPIRETEIF